ncbi:MAG TPA: permease-like cell division protein FtsX [Candidatus Paceibacterota bacterium]
MARKDKLIKMKRVLRAGFFDFWRDTTVSLASVLVMTVTLLFISATVFAGALLDTTLAELRDKIDVNVTFVTTAPEDEILRIKDSLDSLPEVLLVTYVTREEALEAFKERHKNNQSIQVALEELGENPLGAVLNIKARSPSQYSSIAEFLESEDALSSAGLPIIDKINYFENKDAIDRLSAIIHSADRLGLLATLTMAVISMLIAFNTIRLTIYIAREEIAVMRLVGASQSYTQGPFIVVGVIYGIVASVFALLILLPATYYLSRPILEIFSTFDIFSYYLRHFIEIGFIILSSGVFMGALSSAFATRKYLRV